MKGNIVVEVPLGTKHLVKMMDCTVKAHTWAVKYIKNHPDLPFGFNLKGMSALASQFLFKELKKEGVPKVKIAISDEHLFVLVGDSIILDPTVGQIDPSLEVLISTTQKEVRELGYNPDKVFCSDKNVVGYLKEEGWPDFRIPNLGNTKRQKYDNNRRCSRELQDLESLVKEVA